MKKFFTIAACAVALTLNAFTALANDGTSIVRGKITDSEGQALPGATVIIEGTTTGAVSDVVDYILTRVNDGDVTVASRMWDTQILRRSLP